MPLSLSALLFKFMSMMPRFNKGRCKGLSEEKRKCIPFFFDLLSFKFPKCVFLLHAHPVICSAAAAAAAACGINSLISLICKKPLLFWRTTDTSLCVCHSDAALSPLRSPWPPFRVMAWRAIPAEAFTTTFCAWSSRWQHSPLCIRR